MRGPIRHPACGWSEAAGAPLSSAEAGALIDTLAVYRDTGSGVFEAGSDTLVASVGTLSLESGVQTLTLPDGDTGAQVVFGTPARFFVVMTLTSDAGNQTPNHFRVTHLTESSSTAEDRSSDIPLVLEHAPDVSSRSVLATGPGPDTDGDRLLDIVETNTGVYVSPTDTGTDPFDWDTDDDGAGDGWEVLRGTDPNDPDDTPPLSLPALAARAQSSLFFAYLPVRYPKVLGSLASQVRAAQWASQPHPLEDLHIDGNAWKRCLRTAISMTPQM